jgi:hypothetical protein
MPNNDELAEILLQAERAEIQNRLDVARALYARVPSDAQQYEQAQQRLAFLNIELPSLTAMLDRQCDQAEALLDNRQAEQARQLLEQIFDQMVSHRRFHQLEGIRARITHARDLHLRWQKVSQLEGRILRLEQFSRRVLEPLLLEVWRQLFALPACSHDKAEVATTQRPIHKHYQPIFEHLNRCQTQLVYKAGSDLRRGFAELAVRNNDLDTAAQIYRIAAQLGDTEAKIRLQHLNDQQVEQVAGTTPSLKSVMLRAYTTLPHASPDTLKQIRADLLALPDHENQSVDARWLWREIALLLGYYSLTCAHQALVSWQPATAKQESRVAAQLFREAHKVDAVNQAATRLRAEAVLFEFIAVQLQRLEPLPSTKQAEWLLRKAQSYLNTQETADRIGQYPELRAILAWYEQQAVLSSQAQPTTQPQHEATDGSATLSHDLNKRLPKQLAPHAKESRPSDKAILPIQEHGAAQQFYHILAGGKQLSLDVLRAYAHNLELYATDATLDPDDRLYAQSKQGHNIVVVATKARAAWDDEGWEEAIAWLRLALALVEQMKDAAQVEGVLRYATTTLSDELQLWQAAKQAVEECDDQLQQLLTYEQQQFEQKLRFSSEIRPRTEAIVARFATILHSQGHFLPKTTQSLLRQLGQLEKLATFVAKEFDPVYAVKAVTLANRIENIRQLNSLLSNEMTSSKVRDRVKEQEVVEQDKARSYLLALFDQSLSNLLQIAGVEIIIDQLDQNKNLITHQRRERYLFRRKLHELLLDIKNTFDFDQKWIEKLQKKTRLLEKMTDSGLFELEDAEKQQFDNIYSELNRRAQEILLLAQLRDLEQVIDDKWLETELQRIQTDLSKLAQDSPRTYVQQSVIDAELRRIAAYQGRQRKLTAKLEQGLKELNAGNYVMARDAFMAVEMLGVGQASIVPRARSLAIVATIREYFGRLTRIFRDFGDAEEGIELAHQIDELLPLVDDGSQLYIMDLVGKMRRYKAELQRRQVALEQAFAAVETATDLERLDDAVRQLHRLLKHYPDTSKERARLRSIDEQLLQAEAKQLRRKLQDLLSRANQSLQEGQLDLAERLAHQVRQALDEDLAPYMKREGRQAEQLLEQVALAREEEHLSMLLRRAEGELAQERYERALRLTEQALLGWKKLGERRRVLGLGSAERSWSQAEELRDLIKSRAQDDRHLQSIRALIFNGQVDEARMRIGELAGSTDEERLNEGQRRSLQTLIEDYITSFRISHFVPLRALIEGQRYERAWARSTELHELVSSTTELNRELEDLRDLVARRWYSTVHARVSEALATPIMPDVQHDSFWYGLLDELKQLSMADLPLILSDRRVLDQLLKEATSRLQKQGH